MDILSFFIAPFCICLILVGIHCYMGMHVLTRGVIFVDLSLAQVASLGATIALILGFEPHTLNSYFISLFFTFLAAILFAWGKRSEKKIQSEVLIGIVYAFASALIILGLDKVSHGAEHIKELLVGRILWVSWHDVFKTLIIYSFVGLIHYIFRKQIFAVSRGEDIKNKAGWDFLFYALFGIVITSSVGIAGILLVFSFLIAPAVIAKTFVTGERARLLLGWGIGFLLCVIGMFISYKSDLPAGAVLVVCFTIIPILMVIVMPLLKKRNVMLS